MRDRNGRNIQVGDIWEFHGVRDEILAMKPDRLLDALVAEYVVGMKEHRKAYPESFDERVIWFRNPPNVTAYYVPFYSTDIAAAWEVAEQLQKQGYAVCIELLPYEETSVGVYEADPANQIAYAKAQTPAEAICKAALLAVMGE